MTWREPVIGDWSNAFDNTIVKTLDVWDLERETIQNRINSTEFFGELLYAGAWRVNADWQAWWDSEYPPVDPDPKPDEPETPPVDDPETPAP